MTVFGVFQASLASQWLITSSSSGTVRATLVEYYSPIEVVLLLSGNVHSL